MEAELRKRTLQKEEEEAEEEDAPSGASVRAFPVISLSPTSQTYPEPVMLRWRAAL